MRNRILLLILIGSLPLLFCGCPEKAALVTTPTFTESATEVGVGVLSGTLAATHSQGLQARQISPGVLDRLISSAYADYVGPAICPTLARGLACTGSQIVATWIQCYFPDTSAQWEGALKLTFTAGDCTLTPQSAAVTMLREFPTREFDTNRISENGTQVYLNTEVKAGFQTPVSGGIQVVSDGAGGRKVTFQGIRIRGYRKGFLDPDPRVAPQKVLGWEYSVSSEELAISTVGTTQILSSGKINLQENLTKAQAQIEVVTPIQWAKYCCFPIGGKVLTTFTGGKSGTETMDFSDLCGHATYTDLSGATSTLILSQCL
ncbi:hypothetical protein WDW37_01825 [Bdellovibrionota bacterium FG-1]